MLLVMMPLLILVNSPEGYIPPSPGHHVYDDYVDDASYFLHSIGAYVSDDCDDEAVFFFLM